MSGATHSAEKTMNLSGEDQQTDAEMPHATLLQMIEEEKTSDDGINKLKAFLATYLGRIKETDLVRMLQGSSLPKGFRESFCERSNALQSVLSEHFEDSGVLSTAPLCLSDWAAASSPQISRDQAMCSADNAHRRAPDSSL